jgi:hypothetical protein
MSENKGLCAVLLEEFGCYAWIEDGTLFSSEIGEFEKFGFDNDHAVEVTAPEGEFLDAVNEIFVAAEFTLDQFAGR